MIYRGRVENGAIILDDDVRLPDGTEVKVEPVDAPAAPDATEHRTLLERLENVVGKAMGLPEDFAEQHDHYIHGAPKR
ncbi:MAG: hypothetical protein KY475_19390 [Planctomycetes bacterium]|nr:hypothetical protein [Planctomycetota bacterium]